MSLRDKSCYTLSIEPSPLQPGIVELNTFLVDGSKASQAQYVRVREEREGENYSSGVYDALTSAKLASCGYEKAKDKRRRLNLHGPDEDIDFEFTGKLTFEWTFVFENNKYRWTRELYGNDYICSLDRKPDPKVEICLARDSEKGIPGRLQILHYNIDRFPNEIRDLRGLETLLVTTLMCFIDTAEDRSPARRGSSSGTRPVLDHDASSSSSIEGPAPPVPEKVINEDDYEPENPNEILVSMSSSIDDHIARAVGLLLDPAVLFIVIRTRTAAATQRALEVSLGVTRFRHREGLGDLHQYVVEQEDEPPIPVAVARPVNGRSGPKVIKLDDDPSPQATLPRKPSTSLKSSKTQSAKQWSAPKGIAIYLSTIDLPDLKPKIKEKPSASSSSGMRAGGDIPPVPSRPASTPMKNGTASGSGSGSGSSGGGSGNGNVNGNGGQKVEGGKSLSGSTIGKLFRHKS